MNKTDDIYSQNRYYEENKKDVASFWSTQNILILCAGLLGFIALTTFLFGMMSGMAIYSNNQMIKDNNGLILYVKNNRLFNIDSNGKNLKQLKINGLELGLVEEVAYSFDGKMIAFFNYNENENTESYSLYLIKADVPSVTNLTLDIDIDTSFGLAFSHDDESIILKTMDNTDPVKRINIERKDILTFKTDCKAYPKFTKNGKYLVCKSDDLRSSHFIVFDAKSGKTVYEGDKDKSSSASFAISPNSETIAYVSEFIENSNQIRIMNIFEENGNDEIIFKCTQWDILDNLNWSPDGKNLLFRHWNNSDSRHDLTIINIDKKILNSTGYESKVIKSENEDFF